MRVKQRIDWDWEEKREKSPMEGHKEIRLKHTNRSKESRKDAQEHSQHSQLKRVSETSEEGCLCVETEKEIRKFRIFS